MAFKTDSIALKVYADNTARNTALSNGASGELCVTGGSLQISDGSAWAAVDSSSALTISNFHADTYQTSAELSNPGFSDDDTSFLTAKATDDRIDTKLLINMNTVKHTAWNAGAEISSGPTVNNVLFYNTTDQGAYALTLPPVGDYASMAQVQIVNGSTTTMEITRKTNTDPDFNWQTANPPLVTTVDIGRGQRAIFMKTAGNYWDVIILSH